MPPQTAPSHGDGAPPRHVRGDGRSSGDGRGGRGGRGRGGRGEGHRGSHGSASTGPRHHDSRSLVTIATSDGQTSIAGL